VLVVNILARGVSFRRRVHRAVSSFVFATIRGMRGAIVTIALFLLIGAAILTLWPFGGGWAAGGTPAPPGQYPIGWDRPEWSVKEQAKMYGPSPGMGSNIVRPTGEDAMAPKVLCATAATCPAGLGIPIRDY
jgi:hypothetical protein